MERMKGQKKFEGKLKKRNQPEISAKIDILFVKYFNKIFAK